MPVLRAFRSVVAATSLLFATQSAAQAPQPPILIGTGTEAACVVSDEFNRANSTDLGSSWTEDVGNWSIAGNALRSGTSNANISHRQALPSANQWCVVQRKIGNSNLLSCTMRKPDATWSAGDVSYEIGIDAAGVAEWGHKAYFTNWTLINNSCDAGTSNAGEYLGVLLTGTGASTVAKIWSHPTPLADCNVADVNCGWGAPDCTYTNPSTPVDAGFYVGLNTYWTGGSP